MLLINTLKTFLLFTIISITATFSVISYAIPSSQDFDNENGLVLTDQDFFSLPLRFSSANNIQSFLESQNSLLANISVNVNLESDSDILNSNAFQGIEGKYQTKLNLIPHNDKSYKVSEIIWMLSRTNLSSSCSLRYLPNGQPQAVKEVCYDNVAKPFNPGFLLTLIQKESGLVYGQNARLDPNSDRAKNLLDRIVGYYCFDAPQNQSCYDSNPNWKYYKGVFRQLFFATRLIRVRELTCNLGLPYAFSNSNGVFRVGNNVKVGDYDSNNQFYLKEINLKNGISCSMYIYTPYVASQRLSRNVMIQLGIDQNFVEGSGIDSQYIPTLLTTFDKV
jgi:hypothetical protein